MSKPYKNGLVIGKFMPLHKGHELMIEFAKQMSNNVTIIVSGGDSIDINTRYHWLCDMYESTFSNVTVNMHSDFDKIGEPKLVDEFGTALDEDFWSAWINGLNNYFVPFDAVFTNDRYGKVLAEKLSSVYCRRVDWVPIDSNRDTYNISATMIRENPQKHFNMISRVARPYYQKKIAIIGPESTGKSTMAIQLAKMLNGVHIPEYGRTISELRNNYLTSKDFDSILVGHNMHIEAAKEDNMYIVSDTEAYTTYLYSQLYLTPRDHNLETRLLNAAYNQHYDLYILLEPTVPWVDDGTRIMPNEFERKRFVSSFKGFLIETDSHHKCVIVNDNHYTKRLNSVFKSIDMWQKIWYNN